MSKQARLREVPGGEEGVGSDALLCPVDQTLAAQQMGRVDELASDRHKDQGWRENPDSKQRKCLDHGASPPVNRLNGCWTLYRLRPRFS